MILWQPSLPEHYLAMSDDDLASAIGARRAQLGGRVLILGHHYQRDDVIQHADVTGDSLKLSQLAADSSAEFIIFCGVHFMAETADVLTADSVQVILPDLSAGCSMADMADYEDTVDAWETIHDALGADWPGRVIPITYVNSTAAIKAFVGMNGGACCTSTNAHEVFEWALNGGTEPKRDDEPIKILFLPDQHLGRNTASRFGFVTEVDEAAGRGETQTAVWSPKKDHGGLTDDEIRRADVLLWNGHCSVHKLFRPEHVDEFREKHAGKDDAFVLVHPECAKEVVDKADLSGSTEFIIRTIEAAPPGSAWAVGTEFHLVGRLAKAAAARGVSVEALSGCQCLCTTMYRIDQPHLLWVLDTLADGKVVNRIEVPHKAKAFAKVALERMLAHTGNATAATSATAPAG